MVPRPPSPTSLLWAHKLKQEHTHLLNRVKALENRNEKLDARLEAAESNNQALKDDVATIEELTTRIANAEKHLTTLITWKESSDARWKSRIEEDAGEMKALKQKVARLEVTQRKAEELNEKRAASDKAVLDRLQRLEAASARTVDTSQRLGKKNDPVDVRVLSRRLEAIEARRQEDTIRSKDILGRLTTLETANHELLAHNQRLQDAIRTSNTRLFTPALQATPQLEDLTSSSPLVQVPRSPLVEKQARSRPKKVLTAVRTVSAHNISRTRQAAKATHKGQDDRKRAMDFLQHAQIPTSSTLANTPAGGRETFEPANSRKKRKAVPPQVVRQTRSSIRAPTKEPTVPPSSKGKEMMPPPIHVIQTPKEDQTTNETPRPLIIRSEPIVKQASTSTSSVHTTKKRKRRDIPQLEELPAFEAVSTV